MPLLDLVTVPNPILRAPCAKVTQFNETLHTFLDDMFDCMLANNGVGLAAPQVAVSEQVAVIDISSDYLARPTVRSHAGIEPHLHLHQSRLELINPIIVSKSESAPSDEGCLSIPDYRDTISRAYKVSVDALDRHGRAFSLDAEDFLAFAIQHEVDHLNGVLFVDHLSRLKRGLFKRWLMKHVGVESV